jgi:hypothetical protein
MNSTQTPLLTVPLGREAHRQASEFAALQVTPEKGKRVYLNTLAVYAVHSYLKWLQIETALSQSDSWHPGLQAIFDVCDLVLPGIGKLECRPVLPGETTFSLSPEVSNDRIGYVPVQFSERLDEVQLLGFVGADVDTANASEQIMIADIQPLDALLECIPPNVVEDAVLTTSKMPVHLSRWLKNTFEAGWQTVEALFSTQSADLAFSVRSAAQVREVDADNPDDTVSRGKVIDLGRQTAASPVAVLITLAPAAPGEVDIRLRVYPTGGQIYLPPGLQLTVLDESGATSLEAEARSADNWMQLEFSGQTGEQFSIKLALGDISITEDFVI